MTALACAAVAYARAGRPVFPCRARGKEPLVPRGYHDATTDAAQVASWWRRWPMANIGLPCDVTDLLVLDLDARADGRDGIAALAALEDTHGKLPETRTSRTGTGGRHLYFDREGVDGEWRGELVRGVDVKVRGYVMVPPSIHPTGERYAWVNTLPVAPAPGWLLNLALKPVETRAPALAPLPRDLGPYLTAALEGERARVLAAVQGERNHTVNRAAFTLGTLLEHGLAREVAEDTLLAAALEIGLPDYEARRTIRSGLDGGARHPRQIANRRSAA